MKKSIVLLLCLAMALGAAAQRIAVAQPTVDCGASGYQTSVTATFDLRNSGNRRLVITAVKPDCGCLNVGVSKREIAPGEHFTLTLTYDGMMLGHYVKQAAIVSNASEEPFYVSMKGVVLADLFDYSATYPYDFGGLLVDKDNLEFDDVNKGDSQEQELHILNNSQQTMTPNLMHLPSYLTAYAVPERLKPGEAGIIRILLHSADIHDFGLTQTAVYLARNLGEKVQSENEIGISVVLLPELPDSAHETPALSLSSRNIDLGAFKKKKKLSGEVHLTNNGTALLTISSLQMFTPGLRVTLGKRELLPGERTKLRVTAYSEELKRARSKPRVLMITNDPKMSKVVIDINYK